MIAVAATAAQDAPPQPTFRGGINVVRLDVIVTDQRQQPVTNLTAADFEVLENGKAQRIDQFRLVTLDAAAAPDAPAPVTVRSRDDEELAAERDDVRVFAILLDDYHVRRENAMGVKAPLIEFIRTQLRPTDLVGVMLPLTSVRDLRLTHDHDAAIEAIRRFDGRRGIYTPRNVFEEEYALAGAAAEGIRNQVVMTALTGLSARLGSVRDGRKSVIFVSEGFSTGGIRGYDQMRDVTSMANRNNVAIYPLDPRGLGLGDNRVASRSPIDDRRRLRAMQDTLRMLADDTDGRAIVNRNTLAQGLVQIATDSSAYYLLGYSSNQAEPDGKFHRVQVRVKRRGLDVRARKGYWTMTETDMRRASNPTPPVPQRIERALATIASPLDVGASVRTWVGTHRADDGRPRVTFAWEPAVVRGVGASALLRVSLTATDATGRELFSTTSTDRADRIVFDAPPGRLDLKVAVDAGGELLDRLSRTVDVPDFAGDRAWMSTPRVFHVRTALDVNAIASGAGSVPSAGREFSRAERLVVQFDVYGAAGSVPAPSAVLLNRTGTRLTDVPVVAAAGVHQIDLPLGTVAPGEYLIEIAVGEGARDLVAFRVRN